MKYQKFLLMLLIGSLTWTNSCITNSPLSDQPINDPSFLSPDIVLLRSRDEDGDLSEEIKVRLYGEKDDTASKKGKDAGLAMRDWVIDHLPSSVRIMNGSVSVNNELMDTMFSGLSRAPYYKAKEPHVVLGKKYDFSIVLSNGAAHKASITIPNKEITTVDLPKKYKLGTPLTLSWRDVVQYNTLRAVVDFSYKPQEGGTGLSSFPFEIPADSIAKGSYTIPADSLKISEPNINKVLVTLEGTIIGDIDTLFGPGRRIQAKFEITRAMKIKD